jgi:hypothetical protein
MKKTIFIDDIINPKIGQAISTKAIQKEYEAVYNTKFIKEIRMYNIKYENTYVIHVIVPSTSNDGYEKGIYYDVILQFLPISKDDIKLMSTLREYAVKVYCNAPSWMFDFAYVYYNTKNVPDFVPQTHISMLAREKKPEKTNPYGLFGIDKIVYGAMYHIQNTTSFRKDRLELVTVDRKPGDLIRKIMTQDEKMHEIELAKKRAALNRSKNKEDRLKAEKDLKKEQKKGGSSSLSGKQTFQANLRGNLNESFEKPLQNALKEKYSEQEALGKSPLKSKLGEKKKDEQRGVR